MAIKSMETQEALARDISRKLIFTNQLLSLTLRYHVAAYETQCKIWFIVGIMFIQRYHGSSVELSHVLNQNNNTLKIVRRGNPRITPARFVWPVKHKHNYNYKH